MLRALWFAAKLGILVAAAVWVANRPGVIDIHWQGYDIRADVSLALLAALFFVVLLLAAYRALIALFSLPKTWRRYRGQIAQRKGYRSLTLGLTAAAAGDAKLAAYHAHRARALLPDDRGLPVLLTAQAARLEGENAAANAAYETLLENRDTAFLGLRGLLQSALDGNAPADAAALTERALKLYPKHPFVLRMVYDMALKRRRWDDAAKLLGRIEKLKALDTQKIKNERIALLLRAAEEDAGNGGALPLLRRAWNADNGFVPAAERLARYYLEHGKRQGAASVLEKTWKLAPHPDLLPLWKEAAPASKPTDSAARLRWFDRLIFLQPANMDAKMAAAGAAMDEHMWGVARQYLEDAASIGASAKLFHMRAKVAQAQNRPDEAALMIRRAGEAPPEKVWVCRESGHIYDRWSPVAEPHGSFNTIVWDYPQPLRSHHTLAGDDLLRLQG